MKLADMRKKNGLTQKALANASGVSIKNIQQYESGERNINKAAGDRLKKLADCLGCKIEDIME